MPFRNLPVKTGQLFIGLAVVMGLVTMGAMSGGPKKGKTKEVEKVETQMIVVPVAPISEGATLSLDDITAVKWPSAYLPKGATFADPLQVVGRVAKQDLFPGEPIYKEKLSGTTGGGLPALIPDGMRAVTVAVTEVKGVAGFVKPGDRVDVLSTFTLDEGGEEMRMTKTVLQNVLVLASAQSMVDETRYDMETPDGVLRGEATEKVIEEDPKDKKKNKKKKDKEKSEKELEKERKARRKEKLEAEKRARLVSSVTLAVSPEQGEALALAEETGDLRLVLRPENDHKIEQVKSVSLSELLGDAIGRGPASAPPPAAMAVPPMPAMRYGSSVELIEGTSKTNVDF